MAENELRDVSPEMRALFQKGADALQRQNLDYAIALLQQVLSREPGFFECRKTLRAAQILKSGGGTSFFRRMLSGASSSPQVAKAQMALRKSPVEAMQIA